MTNTRRSVNIDKLLTLDAETTGLFFSNESPDDPSCNPITGDYYQAVSWGMVVTDFKTLEPIEKLYVEIKWDGKALWSPKAEAVHGLSKQYLNENGVDEIEAVVQIAELIDRHWGSNRAISTCGINHVAFDIPFLKAMTRRHGIDFRFANRHLEANAVGMVMLDTCTSDQLFEACCLEERKAHNALEDVEMTLEAIRRMRMIARANLG